MATIKNLEARILSMGLRNDRNEPVGLVRARIISGEEEQELTEKETELRTRLGHGTSSIVDGEQQILGSMQQTLDDVDCGWDEDYDILPSVNLFPENDNNSRREEAELDPLDPLEYFRDDGEFQDKESLDDDDFEHEFEADFMSEEEEEEAQIDEEHRVVMELTISQWPPAVIPEKSLCLYCRENIEEATEGTRLPYCPHIFHKHCMVLWLTRRTDGTQRFECPVCRQSMYTPPG